MYTHIHIYIYIYIYIYSLYIPRRSGSSFISSMPKSLKAVCAPVSPTSGKTQTSQFVKKDFTKHEQNRMDFNTVIMSIYTTLTEEKHNYDCLDFGCRSSPTQHRSTTRFRNWDQNTQVGIHNLLHPWKCIHIHSAQCVCGCACPAHTLPLTLSHIAPRTCANTQETSGNMDGK